MSFGDSVEIRDLNTRDGEDFEVAHLMDDHFHEFKEDDDQSFDFEDDRLFEDAWIDENKVTLNNIENGTEQNAETRVFLNLTEMGFPRDKVAEAINLGILTEESVY